MPLVLRVGHWRGQVGASQALAVKTVITAFLAGFLEPDRLVGLVAVDEFGAQHLACANGFAIRFQHFIDHAETGALAQGAVEVDLAGENVGQLADHGVGQTGFIRRGVERAGHRAAGQADAGVHGHGFNAGRQFARSTADGQALELRVRLVAQPAHRQLHELLLIAGFGSHGAARTGQGVAHQGVLAHEAGRLRIDHAQATQQAFGRLGRVGGVAAQQLEVVQIQDFGLLSQCGNVHRLGVGADRHVGWIRAERGHSERAASEREQTATQGGCDGPGVTSQKSGQRPKANGQRVAAIEPDQCALQSEQHQTGHLGQAMHCTDKNALCQIFRSLEQKNPID